MAGGRCLRGSAQRRCVSQSSFTRLNLANAHSGEGIHTAVVMNTRRRIHCVAVEARPNFLRPYRAFLGLRQADLAGTIGCSVALISRIERGSLTPRVHTAVLLARAVGRTMVEVFPELEIRTGGALSGSSE